METGRIEEAVLTEARVREIIEQWMTEHTFSTKLPDSSNTRTGASQALDTQAALQASTPIALTALIPPKNCSKCHGYTDLVVKSLNPLVAVYICQCGRVEDVEDLGDASTD